MTTLFCVIAGLDTARDCGTRASPSSGAIHPLAKKMDARVKPAHDDPRAQRMTAGTVAIRIRGVSHQFGEEGDARHVRALRDTSLDVARGELLCLIGPSGCGKSTLLNVIGGLMTPTTGTVDIFDKKMAGPMPRDIAFVFQENALFPWNTVFENINLGMVFQGVPRAEREARAQRSLEAVGLKDFAAALSRPALRRHAPARGTGPRAQSRNRHSAHGRAVRRARRADPHDPRRGPLGAAVARPTRPSCS